MFLRQLNIWNFRKYGVSEQDSNLPGLIVTFNDNFNLLIGENDSGKTAIIDAIKFSLGTSSEDTFRISESDFFVDKEGNTSKEIKIECIFSGLSEKEAGIFLEWLTFDEKGNYELQVRMTAQKQKNELLSIERIERTIKAGPENASSRLEGLARELLKSTYLKPLRDAEIELKPGVRSRLAQILKNHQAFRKNDSFEKHPLEITFQEANEKVEDFFDLPYEDGKIKTIKSELTDYLDNFFHEPINGENKRESNFKITPVKLNEILKKLSLLLEDVPSGLGSLNLLFIAAELLLHDNALSIGPNITLIEEIEAHLHPQAQLRLIKYLQRNKTEGSTGGQFILTTHSTTLAASTKLEHIILIHDGTAYPMNAENTELEIEDYKFLERFLDSTKANLFFAKGVIFVEGDAENLLVPAIAELIGRPLHKFGVSIVNIGNTAFNRYVKIYSRSSEWLDMFPPLRVPVAVVTDVDIKPMPFYDDSQEVRIRDILIIRNEHLSFIAGKIGVEVEEISHLLDQAYSTKKELINTIDLYTTARLNSNDINEIAELIKEPLSQTTIDSLRENKARSLITEYSNSSENIKVFVASNWTLEYEIAMSTLRNDLLDAIHNVKYKKPTSEANLIKLSDMKIRIEGITNHEEAAYEVYKPLLEKKVSKASVAQQLALLLQSEEDFKEKVKTDEYLKYLRDAIFHVTGGQPNV
ncbi:ATP-dependent nuclease [Paenibacillus sinopodophylli]|uniref:ATP-dependent nuclease n=1 Tax=Paenibacillus sinopodophylli TaxID=1837342 RepID=UPI00110CE1B6|nr:AAA family ATPase [Paenibacillus sinopodophylli]